MTGVMLAREPKMVNREFDYYFSQSKLKKSLAGDFDDVPESSVTVFSDFRGGKSRANAFWRNSLIRNLASHVFFASRIYRIRAKSKIQ